MSSYRYQGKYHGPRRLDSVVAKSSGSNDLIIVNRWVGAGRPDDINTLAAGQRNGQQASLGEIAETVLGAADLYSKAFEKRADEAYSFVRFQATPQNKQRQKEAADTINRSRQNILDVINYAEGTVSREQLFEAAKSMLGSLESAKTVFQTLPAGNKVRLQEAYQQTAAAVQKLGDIQQGSIAGQSALDSQELTPEQKVNQDKLYATVAELESSLGEAMLAVNGPDVTNNKEAKDGGGRRRRSGGRGGMGGMGRGGGFGRGGRGRGSNDKGSDGPVNFMWEMVKKIVSGGRG